MGSQETAVAELVVTGSVSPVGVVGEDLISLLFWNHSSRTSVSLSRAAALPLAACRGASAGGSCPSRALMEERGSALTPCLGSLGCRQRGREGVCAKRG